MMQRGLGTTTSCISTQDESIRTAYKIQTDILSDVTSAQHWTRSNYQKVNSLDRYYRADDALRVRCFGNGPNMG